MRTIPISFNKDTDRYLMLDYPFRVGDNESSTIEFQLTESMLGYKYKVASKLNSQTSVVSSEITPVDNKVSFLITEELTSAIGYFYIQLQLYTVTGEYYMSNIYSFEVLPSL